MAVKKKNVSLKMGKHKSRTGGLTAAGRKKYNAATGSNLKAPQPGGGPRKRSFCARMKGVKGPMKNQTASLHVRLLPYVNGNANMAKRGLYANINRRKKLGISRSKKKSTITPKAYANMKAGFPKKKRKNDYHRYRW